MRAILKRHKQFLGPAFVAVEAIMHIYLAIYLATNWANWPLFLFTVFEMTMFIYLLVNREKGTKESEWGSLSLWQKLTDKNPSRPAKTLHNLWYWTFPILLLRDFTVNTSTPRIIWGKGLTEYLYVATTRIRIRTTKRKDETHRNTPLSRAFELVWVGFFWGFK